MHASPLTWSARILWLTLPLTLGELVLAALDGRSDPVRAVAVVLAWATWAAILTASLLPLPATLVVLRVGAPLAVAGGIAAAIAVAPDALGWIGLATAVVVAVIVGSAEVGLEFINGASYGDETRFPLRPPAVLLLGPIAVVWALVALPLPIGVLLLAAQQWLPGALLVASGAATAWWGSRVLTRLTRRWCVMVPAGLTLVDGMALVEPTLMRRADIARIGPAPVDTTALDLSAGAAGLIVQIDLGSAGSFIPAAGRNAVTEAVGASAVLIAPSRPGALLREAAERKIGGAPTRP